ncbi:MAG: glycosyltransferase family 4 protein [Roseiflexus sp.]|jgi:glycosyltransferase involved in cell wall biosynthesis|nr:glycosyltransferase family 4 protein [Roseiflexus sp.]MBO9365941.1 glycosyltransferase family 4 protein [Roseiflexus sp.]MBO9390786.1 glycosyltransferase family 4 protein [Roseiflexus sp.]
MRLLIISHDVVGQRMAGPGIRAWELARVLSLHAEVTLLATQPIDLAAPGVRTGHFVKGDSASLAEHLRWADVVLANGFLLEWHPELADVRQPLILDMYDPTLLENIELFRNASLSERRDRARRDIDLLNRQLAAGDLFLCATERQRDLYLGALMAAGRITPERVDADPLLRNLVVVVPFGLPASPPQRTGPGVRGVIPGIGDNDPIILWNSGLWDWLDPLTLIRAMPQVIARVPNARLVFMAGKHPGGAAPMRMTDTARALASDLRLLDRHIFFYETWVPYADRANPLLDATIAVSLHRQHLEMAYAAIRSRVLDYLWVGLPAVLSDGDPAAALAQEHGFALVVPPEDPEAVACALITLLTDEAQRAELADRARALAPQYTWTKVVRPIVRFLEAAPVHKPRSASRQRSIPAASSSPTAERIDRRQTLQEQRNRALQALEATWRLDQLTPPAQGVVGKVRNMALERIVWPLLAPLIARQRDHNAAVIHAAYAMAEYQDLLSNDVARLIAAVRLLAQQTRDIAEHMAGLEEADQHLRAALYGEQPPLPCTRTQLVDIDRETLIEERYE